MPCLASAAPSLTRGGAFHASACLYDEAVSPPSTTPTIGRSDMSRGKGRSGSRPSPGEVELIGCTGSILKMAPDATSCATARREGTITVVRDRRLWRYSRIARLSRSPDAEAARRPCRITTGTLASKAIAIDSSKGGGASITPSRKAANARRRFSAALRSFSGISQITKARPSSTSGAAFQISSREREPTASSSSKKRTASIREISTWSLAVSVWRTSAAYEASRLVRFRPGSRHGMERPAAHPDRAERGLKGST